MKKILCLSLVLLLFLFTGCGAGGNVVGRWETETDADDLGLNLSGTFLQTVTRISFLEEGVGTWEIEMVQSREILRREFTYTLEGDQLRINYPDGTAQQFTVDFRKGNLILTGLENYSLKRVKE